MSIDDIGLGLAFAAGVVSFLSPCVLPLVPGYLSFVGGRSLHRVRTGGSWGARATLLLTTLPFVLGFSVVFVALGASASAVGRLFQAYRAESDLVAGLVIVAFGLHMSGLLPLGRLLRHWAPLAGRRTGSGGGPLGSFTLGFSFAFGWTPCIGPVLGGILAAGASAASLSSGVALLGSYAAGLAVPFVAVALAADRLIERLRGAGRWGARLQRASGAVMIAVGLLMATGVLSRLATWLLITFPALSDITL